MLQVKNLSVRYKGNKTSSVKDVSFDIEKCDQLAILGPSGCGKTTILNVISGNLVEREGEAEIGGVLDWRSSFKKPIITMVFQKATLMPWRTVEENVAFGLKVRKISKEEADQRVNEILKVVGLDDFAKKYPRQLSIGMQQRVNFARAVVCQPDLLLLDEPFSALDIKTKKNIIEEFSKIIKEKNITSIFVTHSIKEAANMANKVMILSKRPSEVKKILINESIDNWEDKITEQIDIHE